MRMLPLMILLSMVLMCGCWPERGLQRERGANTDIFRVETIFVLDNQCSVIRFRDAGEWHYFATCEGNMMTEKSCGKYCTYEESLRTSVKIKDPPMLKAPEKEKDEEDQEVDEEWKHYVKLPINEGGKEGGSP